MIHSTQFPDLSYSPPHKTAQKDFGPVFGIDTEAYTTGVPFMFALSTGDVLLPQDFPAALFEPPYINGNFMVYNIKYDSGAFLYHLPREKLYQLWDTTETFYNGYSYAYIPHKALIIKRGTHKAKEKISFWDISQFYKSSLDNASQTYLKRKKIDIRTKKFSEKYVNYFWHYISKYCIQDATLTADLGNYFIDKLNSFDIDAPSLYSCASIAYKYFKDNSYINDVYKLWKNNREVLQYATDAYAGGKFEVTQRGKFTGHEYDIISAYPYEIRNLVDIRKAAVLKTRAYQKDAAYGFIRCRIHNPGKYLPCGIHSRKSGLVYYPSGTYYATITKQEYDYLQTLDIDVKIYSAYWIIPRRISYPYRNVIDKLFSIKSNNKNDRMVYNVSKIIMNSYYGKTVQIIEDPKNKGTYKAGPAWNPIHGSAITANTRIAVCEIQNLLQSDCLAVHTDSVMTTLPIPARCLTSRLGGFEHVITGTGAIIACGMYQINEVCAFKGFKAKAGDTWETILNRYPYRSKIPYSQLHVESWCEAMAKNHEKDKINVFEKTKKIIDLNCDRKRVWYSQFKAKDFFSKTEKSIFRNVDEKNLPEYWQK